MGDFFRWETICEVIYWCRTWGRYMGSSVADRLVELTHLRKHQQCRIKGSFLRGGWPVDGVPNLIGTGGTFCVFLFPPKKYKHKCQNNVEQCLLAVQSAIPACMVGEGCVTVWTMYSS